MTLKKPFDADAAREAFGAQFIRQPLARYYTIRDKQTAKWKIIDRELHRGMVIAIVDFKEVATTIVSALNFITMGTAQNELDYRGRPATHADIFGSNPPAYIRYLPGAWECSGAIRYAELNWNNSGSRRAVLSDILLPSQLNSRYLLPWVDGKFEPPPRS